MQINAKKTKAMVVTRNEGIQAKLEHEGEYLDQVKDFKFLGSYKSADGDCTNEIKTYSNGSSEGGWTDYHLEGQKRHVCVENQSDEVDGLGSVSVWCGGMDIKEIR